MDSMSKYLGKWGETAAAKYLERQGLVIVERNYRCRLGEIDLIAKDGSDWVFIEVKTRRSMIYGHPCEAVTGKKQGHVRCAAEHYALTHDLFGKNLRIDVVEILKTNEGSWLNHIKNAF
ncbi:MAG: YraN family protein [Anaerovoracaceae bacterium]|nr:YraN family protein [Anaerovoracaceae bacterium]